MRNRKRRAAGIIAAALIASTGTAVALTVTPTGGPPGSSFEAQVDCATEPAVRMFPLQAMPQATVPAQSGIESSPGTWTYSLQAGNVDALVTSICDGHLEQFRYDVDAPALFPGPTVASWGEFDLAVSGTTVVGTDCPDGGTASLTLTGPDGYSYSASATPGDHGIWEIPVPADAPQGPLQAEAGCGSIRYAPITFRHPTTTATSSTTTSGGTANPSTTPDGSHTDAGTSAPASPVPATPTYTG